MMLKRLREREEGFTLIELLVVIIIIGILAAIAIPTFLNQRNRGYDAAAKSALKSAATAQESYFTQNNSYSTGVGVAGPPKTLLVAEGYNIAADVTLAVVSATATRYCMSAFHTSNTGSVWYLTSDNGTITQTACT